MRGGEQGVGQRHGQRYTKPEISTSLLATARVLSNNKLKARSKKSRHSGGLVGLGNLRWVHGFFSFERL